MLNDEQEPEQLDDSNNTSLENRRPTLRILLKLLVVLPIVVDVAVAKTLLAVFSKRVDDPLVECASLNGTPDYGVDLFKIPQTLDPCSICHEVS